MPTPGNIQMKSGRWRIYTALRGFRPQWMLLDIDFICNRIRAYVGATNTPLEEARAQTWIMRLHEENEAARKDVLRDMKYVATKRPETLWQKAVAEWAGWLNMLVTVKFAGEKKAA